VSEYNLGVNSYVVKPIDFSNSRSGPATRLYWILLISPDDVALYELVHEGDSRRLLTVLIVETNRWTPNDSRELKKRLRLCWQRSRGKQL